MIIEDGTGQGNAAGVNDDGQLKVLSSMQSRMAYVSATDRMGFIWYSTYACQSGDVVLYIKNTDPERELSLNTLVAGGTGNQVWRLEKVLTVGTVSGVVITPVNTVLGSGKLPLTTAYGNAAVAGISSTVVMVGYYTMAGASDAFDAQGSVVVRANDQICLRSGTSGTVHVFVTGFYAPNMT